MGGGQNFDPPIFGAAPILDGVQFAYAFPIAKEPQNAGVHVLTMGDGSSVVQRPFLDSDRSGKPKAWSWTFTQRAFTQAEWRKVTSVEALGMPVWFADFDVEVEVWRTVAGANSLTLSRPIASAKVTGWDAVNFPNKAFLDDVEQTVVATSPSAGEIQITDDDVITPTLSAGQILVVEYFAAYPVIIPNLGRNLAAFAQLDRAVTLLETAQQVPS